MSHATTITFPVSKALTLVYHDVLACRHLPIVVRRPDGTVVTPAELHAQMMLPAAQLIDEAEMQLFGRRSSAQPSHQKKSKSPVSNILMKLPPKFPRILLLRVTCACVSFLTKALSAAPVNMFVLNKKTRYFESCITDRVTWGLRRKAKAAAASRVERKANVLTAATNGDIMLVQDHLIASNCACVQERDEEGRTALMWSAWHGHTDICRLLIESKADANARNKNANNALIYCARHGSADVGRLLIQSSADPNAKNDFGSTALMYCASEGHLDVCRLLVEAGADTLVRRDDNTALRISVMFGKSHVATYLRSVGAPL